MSNSVPLAENATVGMHVEAVRCAEYNQQKAWLYALCLKANLFGSMPTIAVHMLDTRRSIRRRKFAQPE
jgi:hypothetical protein